MPTILAGDKEIETKFPWKHQYEYYVTRPFDSAITVLVSRYSNSGHGNPTHVKARYVGMWEIIIGNKYLSRDRGKYFEKPHEAILTAEKVLRRLAEGILERINKT